MITEYNPYNNINNENNFEINYNYQFNDKYNNNNSHEKKINNCQILQIHKREEITEIIVKKQFIHEEKKSIEDL